MTSIFDCIQRAADAGDLDKERAVEAQSEYTQLVERFSDIMPLDQAERAAHEALKEATRKSARSRRHAILAQLQAMHRLQSVIDTATNPAAALRNLLEYSEGSGYGGDSVVSLQRAYIRSINAGIRQVLEETGRDLLGRNRQPALYTDILRELHGEASGNAQAAQLARAVEGQQERMRLLFNAHGGDIGKLEGYGVPHAHDRAQLLSKGWDDWRDTMLRLGDWHRMIDPSTGKAFTSLPDGRPNRAAAERFLRAGWDNITTDGWARTDPKFSTGGKALYNQRADHRVLHFKGADAWLEYNEAFGTSNPFDAMMGGLHGMARDVAQMRVLGPNPRMGLEFARQAAEKRAAQELADAAGDPDGLKLAQRQARKIRNQGDRAASMLAHIDGSANVPVAEGWANFFGGARAVLTSIQLGSALLSSVTDTVTQAMAARVVGMRPSNVLSRTSQLIASSATRDTAAQMGYVADTLASTGAGSARYLGDTFSPEITQRLADFTLRASGLNFWTDMNRLAFQMEFAGYLATHRALPFDGLPEKLRGLLAERGIGAEDWAALTSIDDAIFTAPNGARFLSPIYWREAGAETLGAARAEQLSTRLQMIVEEQMEYAVPTAKVEGTALIQSALQPGTFMGELARSVAQYKSFALSLTLGQIRRFLAFQDVPNRWLYAVQLTAGLTLIGGVAVQLKELAKGRDPRPMDDLKFWQAAAFQGGGLGIFGDFFYAETSRAGGGLAETILGPVVGAASDVIQPVASNLSRAVAGDDMLIGRDVSNLVRRYTPVASSLWHTRLAYDRLVADQLQDFLDPDATVAWRRAEQRLRREFQTEEFWERGALSPERFPEFSNILGDAR